MASVLKCSHKILSYLWLENIRLEHKGVEFLNTFRNLRFAGWCGQASMHPCGNWTPISEVNQLAKVHYRTQEHKNSRRHLLFFVFLWGHTLWWSGAILSSSLWCCYSWWHMEERGETIQGHVSNQSLLHTKHEFSLINCLSDPQLPCWTMCIVSIECSWEEGDGHHPCFIAKGKEVQRGYTSIGFKPRLHSAAKLHQNTVSSRPPVALRAMRKERRGPILGHHLGGSRLRSAAWPRSLWCQVSSVDELFPGHDGSKALRQPGWKPKCPEEGAQVIDKMPKRAEACQTPPH